MNLDKNCAVVGYHIKAKSAASYKCGLVSARLWHTGVAKHNHGTCTNHLQIVAPWLTTRPSSTQERHSEEGKWWILSVGDNITRSWSLTEIYWAESEGQSFLSTVVHQKSSHWWSQACWDDFPAWQFLVIARWYLNRAALCLLRLAGSCQWAWYPCALGSDHVTCQHGDH